MRRKQKTTADISKAQRDPMHTTFFINGGIGRVVAAIPALEKYHRLNPEDDFKIIVSGWDQLFWSHPILQSRTFLSTHKGIFNTAIVSNSLKNPEPYFLYDFYNQKCNLVEAWDQCINNTKEHQDLNYQCLHVDPMELATGRAYINNIPNRGDKPVIVMQPFGSGAMFLGNTVVDKSNRSFSQDAYLYIARALNSQAVILFASPTEFRHVRDDFTYSFDQYQPYIRALMSLVANSDMVVSVCSSLQHIGRALGRSGVVIMGGTNAKSFSYTDHFSIYRKKDRDAVYLPWRIAEADCEYGDRANAGLMDFNQSELDEIIDMIRFQLQKLKPVDPQIAGAAETQSSN